MLANKTALITGSSQGIGLGVAQAYLASGARIVTTSERRLADCPEVQQLMEKYPERVFYVPANMMEGDAPRAVVAQAWEILGGIDILVNNVGTFREPGFLQLTQGDFQRIFHLNVWVALECSQEYAARCIGAKRPGRIIFTTSLNGSRSEPAHTLYDASKGAIDALTRQLAIELGDFGITTVAVAPGLVETPLTDMGLRSDPDARKTIENQIPVRRIATVEDLAWWYVFLGSDRAQYATGAIIAIDGGLNAQQMPTRPIASTERMG